MTNPPADQHFLPRFYLRGFGEGDEIQVRRRDGAHFSTGTAAVGHERFMYDHPDLPAGWVESEYLKQVDGMASEALRAVRDEGVPSRMSQVRWEFAHFLVIQSVRTPETRNRLDWPLQLRRYAGERDVTKEIVRQWLRKEHLGFEPASSEVAAAYDLAVLLGEEDYDEDEAGRVFLRKLLEPSQEMLDSIAMMDWTLETARKPRLITSDSPLVTWRKPTPRDKFEGIGIQNAEEVRFPLDAGRQLVLTPPSHGDGHREVEPQRVLACNQDQALACHKFIVGHPRREYQLSRIELPPHRPIIRFNTGPAVERSADGTWSETGADILHMWTPRQ